jgi:hypothetical protein
MNEYNPNYKETASKEQEKRYVDKLMGQIIESVDDGYDHVYFEEDHRDTDAHISDQTAFGLSLMTFNPLIYIPTGGLLFARSLIDKVAKRDWRDQEFNGYSRAKIEIEDLNQEEVSKQEKKHKLDKTHRGFRVDPLKHFALITLVTASVVAGYFKDSEDKQPDTNDFENVVNNINDIVDNSYHVRQIPQVVIDGDDVYVPQAQVSTGEVSSSNSETTVIGRITAFGDASADGYLITAGLSSDLLDGATFNDVMANQVTSIYTDVRVNL